MKPFSGSTDVVNENVLPPDVRAYFSATGARLREQVWLRIETRWVADGTSVKVTVYRNDGENREAVENINGRISGSLWEQQWRVELPKAVLDEVHGDIQLTFDAEVKGVQTVRSQVLLVHRTAFSS